MLLTGCVKDYEKRIVCDSGFKTPWVDYIAYIDDGSIYWQFNQYDKHYTERRMLAGEICRYELKEKHATN